MFEWVRKSMIRNVSLHQNRIECVGIFSEHAEQHLNNKKKKRIVREDNK